MTGCKECFDESNFKICVITAIFQIFGAAAETQDLTEAGCIIMGHATQLKTRNSLTAQDTEEREFNVQPPQSFDEWDVALITKAMAELQEALHCLKFRVFPANSTLRGDHIRIWKGKVCSSYVGRQGGAQPIYLTSPGCMAVGLIQHELLHALGFNHEHNRPDRDKYIKVQWDNIRPGLKSQFYTSPSATVANYGVPYNVGSVMHYSSRAFSVDRNHPSIVQKNGELIPVPSGLQDTDIMKLRRMYNCKVRYAHFSSYTRYSKWAWIPAFGTSFVVVYIYQACQCEGELNETDHQPKGWKISCYRTMPLRSISRTWGWLHSVTLPVWARTPVLKAYASAFNCSLSEAEVEDLREYENLGQFFRRGLKPGIRPISYESPVVSPADGSLLHFGKVETDNCTVEQVKGLSYSLSAFIGPRPPTWSQQDIPESKSCCSSLLKNEGTSLYQCSIYLAPGDYHRFHSPVDWTIYFRRHFQGELLSVNPVIARWIPGLFTLNERVAYFGEWEHGFFCFVAVGATNVGSIHVYDDSDLKTNSFQIGKKSFIDKEFEQPLNLTKGDSFGEFNFGSTIILLFEAPSEDFELVASSESKLKYGEALFKLNRTDFFGFSGLHDDQSLFSFLDTLSDCLFHISRSPEDSSKLWRITMKKCMKYGNCVTIQSYITKHKIKRGKTITRPTNWNESEYEDLSPIFTKIFQPHRHHPVCTVQLPIVNARQDHNDLPRFFHAAEYESNSILRAKYPDILVPTPPTSVRKQIHMVVIRKQNSKLIRISIGATPIEIYFGCMTCRVDSKPLCLNDKNV
ncbi:Phosphatidylserine decarboxylase proenzyme [Orchesella cincta]|uniref:Phosphatidylserine decarboxylase proenzyme, mitochondrial n=1 Tax=Orchesella cincta TaxID=48709 RepID=A0A1D2M510_ORCCI|nr:Phosphatidylserine decarboxylase proenzyme [Orchesella cincta]